MAIETKGCDTSHAHNKKKPIFMTFYPLQFFFVCFIFMPFPFQILRSPILHTENSGVRLFQHALSLSSFCHAAAQRGMNEFSCCYLLLALFYTFAEFVFFCFINSSSLFPLFKDLCVFGVCVVRCFFFRFHQRRMPSTALP